MPSRLMISCIVLTAVPGERHSFHHRGSFPSVSLWGIRENSKHQLTLRPNGALQRMVVETQDVRNWVTEPPLNFNRRRDIVRSAPRFTAVDVLDRHVVDT